MRLLDKLLPVGPRSVLLGAHCFFLHPFFVFAAWWKLYGFPWDPRLWAAFFVHDLGYLFYWCRNMDGEEGEMHPYFGARIMGALFGSEWYNFTLYHSRFLARRHGRQFSRLCVADKYATCLIPAWLYLPMVRLTGEMEEYIRLSQPASGEEAPKYAAMQHRTENPSVWFQDVQEALSAWVQEHRDGRSDTWTPKQWAAAPGKST